MVSVTRILFVPLLAVSVLAYGVHQSTSLLGNWKVKSVSVPVSGPQAEKAKAVIMTSTIKFSRDKSFEMMLGGPMKGNWTVKGHDVALAITEMMGRKMTEIVSMARSNYAKDPSPRNKAGLAELSKPLMAVLSSDGKTLTLKSAPGKAGIVFMKG